MQTLLTEIIDWLVFFQENLLACQDFLTEVEAKDLYDNFVAGKLQQLKN